MSPPRTNDWRIWLLALLSFGAGLAITRRALVTTPDGATASHAPPSPLAVASAAGEGLEGIPAPRADRLVDLHRELEVAQAAVAPAPPVAAIQKSRLPEWMRFRYEHSRVALSTEMAVRNALDAPNSLLDVARACGAEVHAPSVHQLDLSAELEVREREAVVHGWGCDASDDAPVETARMCECLVERIRPELQVTVPPEVADKDLATYDGALTLRVWL